MINKKRGFTLVELLVVVLIIGILAAIALPQYQKAVLKSRMTQLRVSLDALKGAQERYLLANAVYTNDRDNLDIQFSGSDTCYPNTEYRLKIRGGFCGIEGTGSTPSAQSNVYCKLETEPQISLWYYLVSGKRMCCNHSINNELGTKICQQETNSYTAYIDTAQKICYYK